MKGEQKTKAVMAPDNPKNIWEGFLDSGLRGLLFFVLGLVLFIYIDTFCGMFRIPEDLFDPENYLSANQALFQKYDESSFWQVLLAFSLFGIIGGLLFEILTKRLSAVLRHLGITRKRAFTSFLVATVVLFLYLVVLHFQHQAAIEQIQIQGRILQDFWTTIKTLEMNKDKNSFKAIAGLRSAVNPQIALLADFRRRDSCQVILYLFIDFQKAVTMFEENEKKFPFEDPVCRVLYQRYGEPVIREANAVTGPYERTKAGIRARLTASLKEIDSRRIFQK